MNPGPFARFVWPKQRGFTVAGAAFGRHAPTTSTRRDLWSSSRVYKGSTALTEGPSAPRRIVLFRRPSPSSSVRPTTLVSPHSGAFAPLIRRRRGFSVLRAFLRRCRAAVVPSRTAIAWFRRSRSAFSSVRILSSVKGGSSHSVVGLIHTRLSLSPRRMEYPTPDECTSTRP